MPDMLDDRYLDVDKYVPHGRVACATCAHYEGGHKCKAFPQGIHQEILDGKDDHRKPYHGDHGIQYEELTTGLRRRYAGTGLGGPSDRRQLEIKGRSSGWRAPPESFSEQGGNRHY